MFGVTGLCFQIVQSRRAYRLWAALWVISHALGGVALGAILGGIGGVAEPVLKERRMWVLCIVVILCGALDWFAPRFSLPSWQRQVRRDWMFQWPLWATAVGYGMQLGGMVATRITHSSSYAVVAAAMLSTAPLKGAAICGAFGLARSLPAAMVGSSLPKPDDAFRFAAHLGTQDALARRWARWVMLSLAIGLATGALFGDRA